MRTFAQLSGAIAYTLTSPEEGCELTSEQALEFLSLHRGQLANQRVMLMRELIDCGCGAPDCEVCNGKGICFTEVWDDDLDEIETDEEFVAGFTHWQLWLRG